MNSNDWLYNLQSLITFSTMVHINCAKSIKHENDLANWTEDCLWLLVEDLVSNLVWCCHFHLEMPLCPCHLVIWWYGHVIVSSTNTPCHHPFVQISFYPKCCYQDSWILIKSNTNSQKSKVSGCLAASLQIQLKSTNSTSSMELKVWYQGDCSL